MKETSKYILEELFERYPQLLEQKENIQKAFSLAVDVYKNGNMIYTCGNGGSASDSEHIVGELLKSFKKKRQIDQDVKEKLLHLGEEGEKLASTLEGSLPCVSLTSHVALSTAFANDKEPTVTFAQQLYGLGKAGDCLITISTSGNSKNCVYASIVAKAKGIKVIALTGQKESRLMEIADVTIRVPETETFKVQELHLPIYHALCAYLEEEFF